MRLKKILLVTNIPNPYRLALFNELSTRMKADGIELKVLFGSAGYARRKFQLDWSEAAFNYEILDSPNLSMGNTEKTLVSYSGLMKIIRREKPDKIIVSGFSLATFKIWLRSLFIKTDYLIWSGSVEFPGWYDSSLRVTARKIFTKRASSYIAYGTKARDYFVKLGASPEKICIALNTVDTDFFAMETKRIRSQVSLPRKKHLLYVGYLEPRKNVANLIAAIGKLAQKRDDFVLDIVGDGSQKAELEQAVTEKGLGEIVRFHGFRQKNELPAFFAEATCFLFQTDFDIWGLVLNEAMAAGLPCISSKNAGASYDLIQEGNGYVVDYNLHDELIRIINGILDNPEKSRKTGEEASAFIRSHASLSVSATGFMNAIRTNTNL